MTKKTTIGLMFIALSLTIVVTSAFVYEQASQTTTQTILEIATITLNDSVLGNIEEGETILYTATNTSAINDVLSITTGKADAYLHIDTDLEGQNSNYATYQIKVIVDSAPGTLSGTVATLTIGSPDTASGITLDAAGAYVFDFEITTTANQVSSDQGGTVNITVTAESTNT